MVTLPVEETLVKKRSRIPSPVQSRATSFGTLAEAVAFHTSIGLPQA
jgi:hypothetical protein